MKKSSQKGFTLLEILIAMAVTAIIGLAIGRVVIQVVTVNAGSNTREIAIKQMENAVHIISRDALQTQQFMPTNSSGNPKPVDPISKQIAFDLAALPTGDKLILNWTAWDNAQTVITYDLDLPSGKLYKRLSVNGGQQVITEVANYIVAASGNWDTAKKVLNLTITATVKGNKPSTETRTFQIAPAPAQ